MYRAADNVGMYQIIFGKIVLFLFTLASILMVCCVADVCSQDWVHPNNRHKYKGYELHKTQKAESPIWTYRTNRPRGNTRGGGTTSYRDYQPNYKPPLQFSKKKYKRPKKAGSEVTSRPCNCGK